MQQGGVARPPRCHCKIGAKQLNRSAGALGSRSALDCRNSSEPERALLLHAKATGMEHAETVHAWSTQQNKVAKVLRLGVRCGF